MKKQRIYLLITCIAIFFLNSACETIPSSQLLEPVVVTRILANDLDNLESAEAGNPENLIIDRSTLTCADEMLTCIGLIISSGKLDDNSYNQSTWDALKRAKVDLQAQVEIKEITDASEFSAGIDDFAEKGFDIVVTVGRAIYASTVEAASTYPDIHFIGVDQYEYQYLENAVGLMFPNYHSGFLAGALATMSTQTGKIGAVLGAESSVSEANFKHGFEDGARAINSDVEILVIHNPIKIGASSVNPAWGTQAARELLGSGVDVVLASAGEAGDNALIEVANNSKALCIGTGADRWLTLPEAHPCLISSAIQEVPNGVFTLIGWSSLGKMPTGEFTGRVHLAPFYSFADLIPAEAKAILKDLDQGLADNTIPTDGSYSVSNAPLFKIDR